MRKKPNADLRAYSNTRNVPQWKIAKEGFGVADTTFCKWMREEFSEEMKAKYRAVVDNIAAGKGVQV